MKKYISLFAVSVLSAAMLTGCADKLDGRWELCGSDGEKVGIIRFDSDEGEVRIGDYIGSYEDNDSELKIEWDSDDFNEQCGGTFSYEILEKEESQLYIEGVAEAVAGQKLSQHANSLMKAANSALTEMDANGMNIFGYWVVSSDDEFCLVPGGQDSAALLKNAENYFPSMTEYEYVICIENGVASEAYIAQSWTKDICGGYTSDKGEFFITNKNLEDIAGELIG